MIRYVLISLLCLTGSAFADPWIGYGTVTLSAGAVSDNPTTNSNGLIGEISFPYTVPSGHQLTITYMEVEGPACDYSSNYSQFGMALWIGSSPCTNAKCVLSCTTTGGSNQCNGMSLVIPAGKIVNIRCMNNTSTAWVNGFCVQGSLDPS